MSDIKQKLVTSCSNNANEYSKILTHNSKEISFTIKTEFYKLNWSSKL